MTNPERHNGTPVETGKPPVQREATGIGSRREAIATQTDAMHAMGLRTAGHHVEMRPGQEVSIVSPREAFSAAIEARRASGRR